MRLLSSELIRSRRPWAHQPDRFPRPPEAVDRRSWQAPDRSPRRGENVFRSGECRALLGESSRENPRQIAQYLMLRVTREESAKSSRHLAVIEGLAFPDHQNIPAEPF